MQLAGPEIWGPPRDVDAAIAVLREAIASGVNHIDTSDFYGPHVTNQIIEKALHSYPDNLVIVNKLGARRGEDKSWLHALSRQELIDGAHDNLRNLGVDALDVVNLRVGGMMAPSEGSIEERRICSARLPAAEQQEPRRLFGCFPLGALRRMRCKISHHHPLLVVQWIRNDTGGRHRRSRDLHNRNRHRTNRWNRPLTRSLELQMNPVGGRQNGTAVTVVSGVDDVLQPRGDVHAAPDVRGVEGSDDIFTSSSGVFSRADCESQTLKVVLLCSHLPNWQRSLDTRTVAS
jgi:hypothetical protein